MMTQLKSDGVGALQDVGHKVSALVASVLFRITSTLLVTLIVPKKQIYSILYYSSRS